MQLAARTIFSVALAITLSRAVAASATPSELSTAAIISLPTDSPLAQADQELGQCNTGRPIQCCQQLHNATGPIMDALGTLLGVAAGGGGIAAQVGVGCSPLRIIGVSGTDCNQQAACCAGNTYHGVISLGCTPVHVGA